MLSFSNLVSKVKVNGKELNDKSINDIFLKTSKVIINNETVYKLKIESDSFIQIFLKSENACVFFSRNNIIEYFSEYKKIAEFKVISECFESVELLDEKQIIINLFGQGCLVSEEFNPEKFCLKTSNYPNEIVWQTHRDIRYHFIEATESTLNNQLIVVFAGMGLPFVYKYNYSKALAEIPCHKLFILDDYGDRGSYYLGNNGDSLVETSVISLILNVASRYNIPLYNILSMGSSKGGYAALYYGIKYSFGKVVAAAPQTLLGNFLEGFTLDMVKDITGDKGSAGVSFLNEKLFSLFKGNRTYPNIHLMVGSLDSHLYDHLQPLITKLRELKIPYEYEVIEGYNHNAFGLFQNYFTQKANFLVLNRDISMYVSSIQLIQQEPKVLKCHVHCDKADNMEFAYYWYQNKIVIDKQFYVRGKVTSELVLDRLDGIYDVIVFVKYNNMIIKLITDTLVVNN